MERVLSVALALGWVYMIRMTTVPTSVFHNGWVMAALIVVPTLIIYFGVFALKGGEK